jgi:hypothetical protein
MSAGARPIPPAGPAGTGPRRSGEGRGTNLTPDPQVADVAVRDLPPGASLLFVSDLHLRPAGVVPARAERHLLRSLAQTFQIESLGQLNDKFDPQWQPRYLAYSSPAHLPDIPAAAARAASFWELPWSGASCARLWIATRRERSPRYTR